MHHAKILLFKKCSKVPKIFAWKNYTKRDIDCILQVGDIGAFPNPAKLDTSTARFSDHDIEELGFHKFLKDTGDSRNYFGNGGDFEDTDMYFIKGNHEDFDYLDSFNIISPVDFHKRIMYAPNGQVIKLGKFIKIDYQITGGNPHDGFDFNNTLYFKNGEYNWDELHHRPHQTPIFKG